MGAASCYSTILTTMAPTTRTTYQRVVFFALLLTATAWPIFEDKASFEDTAPDTELGEVSAFTDEQMENTYQNVGSLLNQHLVSNIKQAKADESRSWWHGWINGWDGNMGWHVSGSTFISGLHSTHDNWREDRRFKPLLTTIGTSQRSHHWSGWVNNMDHYFAYSCPGNMAIIGFKSYHSNHYEDRRWKILCSSFHHVNIGKSGWPHWQTNWDATWSIGCGHRPLVGLSSYHDNHKEDRRWRVQCGTITNRL